MPNQTLAITLTWGPAAGQLSDYDLNQLGVLLAAHLSAAVQADVTFIPQVVNDPGSFDTQLIFNITQRIFKGWDAGTGRYVAVTEYAIGDIKNTFVGVDDIARGWVILNGRAIAAVPGITGAQQAALLTIFPGGVLPIVTPANVSGLPVGNAFGEIVWPPSINPVVTPTAATLNSITFTNPVVDTEAGALRDETVRLRDSAQDAFDVTKQIQAVAQQLLTALNVNTTPPIYAAVFAGYA